MTFNFGSRKNNYLHEKPHDIFLGKKSDMEKNSPGTKVTWNKSYFTFFQGKKSPKNVTWKKIMQLFFWKKE